MEDQDEDMPGPSVDSQVDKNGLGLDVGGHTRENTGASKTSSASAGASRPTNRGRGSHKRARDDEDDDGRDDEEGDQKSKKPAGKKAPQGMPPSSPVAFPDGDDNDEGEGETHADMQPYCICQKPSYGEMIGCDNDDCDIEWVSCRHTTTGCLG
jgi:inhibitor of growth protein 3